MLGKTGWLSTNNPSLEEVDNMVIATNFRELTIDAFDIHEVFVPMY